MAKKAKTTEVAWFRGCWLAALALVLGCTSSNGVDRAGEQNIGSQAQDLGTPITVTLSTPNPVSPIAPVVECSNSLFLGAGTEIVSGSLVSLASSAGTMHAEPDALLNETWSRGSVELRDRVNVRGILHAATLATPLGNGVVISSRDSTPNFDPLSKLAWTVTYPSSTPGPDVNAFVDESKNVDPGQYGTLNASSRGTLTLRTGTYYLSSLIIESAGTVRLDQSAGPVIIYMTNTLTLRGSIVSLSGAAPDLLLGYLGTTPVFVESLFNGAIIAPFTTLTLRAVTGIHTGFFAAKDFQVLDAHVRIQYRAPLALVAAAKPAGLSCRQILAGAVPPASLSQASLTYCRNCPDDTDRDGVPDCMDGCPYDATKVESGVCGCGVPETDSDNDGFPDCVDRCPNDPNNTTLGECGCLGLPGLKAAGTPCDDTACPQTGATCNGAGVCGNRAACVPGTNCKVFESGATFYHICGERFPNGANPAADAGSSPPPGQLPESGAQTACSAKGMTLTRIDTLPQNELVSRFVTTPLWLGANEISASGAWRWSAPNSNNGDSFWSGGGTGTRVNNLFSNWGGGAPGTRQCAVLRRDGQWFDADCTAPAGYICEYRLTGSVSDGGTRPPGMPSQPPPRATACIAEQDAGLPTDAEVLKQQIANSARDVFQGAAANPPPVGSHCSDDASANGIGLHQDAGEGCDFINIQKVAGAAVRCFQDSDCNQFGAGFLCRQIKDDPTCNPSDAGNLADGGLRGPVEGGTCLGHSVCGQISCPVDPFPNRCNQIEVCGPYPDFDAAGPDPQSNLDAEPFVPGQLFDAGIPDASFSAGYKDDPIRGDAGKNHPWCFMGPQNPNAVPPATQQAKGKKGTSGAGSVISFGFDPDLVFDVQAPQLALGVPNLGLHAAASFVARVNLNNFLGQRYSANIVDIAAGINAKLCRITDKETHFQVLGLDFIDPADLRLFDTMDSQTVGTTIAGLSRDCGKSVDTFGIWANRAKKAFRDAQQLVSQYKTITSAGNLMSGDLCKKIGVIAADVPGFPGGNFCYPNEPVEITINRFIDYFQLPGSSQMTELKQAAGAMSKGINDLVAQLKGSVIHLDFVDANRQESQTIVNVPFAIGPVPMVLQIDAFAQYGIAGGFSLDYDFSNIFNLDSKPMEDLDDPLHQTKTPPKTVAKVRARVVPHAAAGLAAFVAAGFSLGPFNATAGIEGAVTIADIKAPVYAGAGLGVVVTKDIRPLPAEITALALPPEASQFTVPKAFKFFVAYDYGAAVDLTNVMSGEINAKVRIKFFFFSRTWRKRVVKFSGWSKHIDLVSGGNTLDFNTIIPPQPVVDNPPPDQDKAAGAKSAATVVQGATTMGLSETQVPLMKLPYLDVPETPAGAGASVIDFDAGPVQGMFYDDLCCAKQNEFCSFSSTPQCCPGFTCFSTDSTIQGFCAPRCKTGNEKCKVDGDCCPATAGPPIVCGRLNTCVQCRPETGSCADDGDCCAGLTCGADKTCSRCRNPTELCTLDSQCCGNVLPDGGIDTTFVCATPTQAPPGTPKQCAHLIP
jgi:hypothetical protein